MLHDDPLAWFAAWFSEAQRLDVVEANAVTLATADASGRPSARVVLLKGWDERGFVIYTNLRSRKGREMQENPYAALCFYWDSLGRQVRVRGSVTPVSPAEADTYWASRGRGSQLGGWASEQSQPLASRETLLSRVDALEAQYRGAEVPRPAHWTGMRIEAEEIEFWSRGESRLHDRFVFKRQPAGHDPGWKVDRLNP